MTDMATTKRTDATRGRALLQTMTSIDLVAAHSMLRHGNFCACKTRDTSGSGVRTGFLRTIYLILTD